MWTLLVLAIMFMAATSILVGLLVGLTLRRLGQDQVAQYCSSRRGIVGLGLGGAFLSLITALTSLAFRPLLQIPLAPLWSSLVHVIAVTVTGISGVYLGTWLAVQSLRGR